MVVKFSWKSVLDDLLEDDYKGVGKTLEVSGPLLYLGVEVVETDSHDGWIFVTEGLLHLRVHLVDELGSQPVELDEDKDSLFAH